MKIKVDNFTINIHRAEESSCKDEIKRLANYVYTICELEKQAKKENQRVVNNLKKQMKGECK